MTNESGPATAVIFGGAGFIGRAISAHLLAGDDVSDVLLADIASPKRDLEPGERFAKCDVREPIDLPLDDVRLIVNLAAVHRTPGHEDWEYHETNENGAENIVAFAESAGCSRIWFTSSIAVYGPDEEAKVESSVPTPVSAYGKSKLAAEAIHTQWAVAEPGRMLVIARPATVFGQGEHGNFSRLATAMRNGTFLYPGRRDTLKACGYVKDLPRAFEFMERQADPVALFNFAYAKPPTIQEVCEAFARVGSLRKPYVTLPASAMLKIGSTLNSIGISSVNPERVKKLMNSTNVEGKALSDSGFEFEFDLNDGIADWYAQPPANKFD